MSERKIMHNSMNRKKIPALAVSIGVLLGFLAVFYMADSKIIHPLNLKIIFYIAAIMLPVGMGQSFAVLIGGIDLSVGGIISLISVVNIMLLPVFGVWAIPLSLLIGAVCGFINGLLLISCRIPSFLLTLGTGGVFTSVTYLINAAPMNYPGSCMKYAEIFNGTLGPFKLAWIWAFLFFLLIFGLQKFTYFGRTIYAVGVNEKMAWMSGINVKKTRVLAYVVSGVGAALAGLILSSRLYSGSAVFGNSYILESIACVVIGGIAMTGGSGNALNVLIGAVTMGIIKNGLTIAGVDVMAQQCFLGVLIILAVAITFDRSKVSIVK